MLRDRFRWRGAAPDDLAPPSDPQRYLALLGAALLDEHYLENEVRLEYLNGLGPGAVADPAVLRDPVRTLPVRFNRLAAARRAGRSTDARDNRSYFPYTDIGRAGLDHLEQTVRALPPTLAGDVADVGVGRGGAGVFLRGCLVAHGQADRTLWVVDRFVATDPDQSSVDPADPLARFRADLNQVRDAYARFDLLDEHVKFLIGPYDQSLVDPPVDRLALLRIGESVGSSLDAVLRRLLPLVVPGGWVVVQGVGGPATEQRLADARTGLGVTAPVVRVDWNTVAWQVPGPGGSSPSVPSPSTAIAPSAGSGSAVDGPSRSPHRVLVPAPVAPGTDRVDLSVVVVFYDMQREARRTLLSLSRSYQQGIDDLSYEVIVIDNGSPPGRALDRAEVEAHGSEFRFIDLAGAAEPSPTVALNHGVQVARGRNVALMIDGAHVLTPGVLRLGMAALATYEPAIVAVQQWYVGPGQQGDAQQAGYDQAVEDRLFRNIRWPVDGYRLFEIGHFIGDRDWFDGIVESNCLFVPRDLLEQVGAFDDSFAMPGGGYANLELFERLGGHPGVNAASILGEGSFHQFHGGTTTNVSDEAVRRERVFSYGRHFTELRGRGLLGLNSPVNFVGSMATKAARRTRSRREITLAFDPGRDTVTTTSSEAVPVPDELKLAAVEALWDRQAWREATWLGLPVNRFPTDLHSYQELLVDVRPDVVVLAADDPGLAGRALHVASVCDLLDQGRVVAVGAGAGDVPSHPRITAVTGDPTDPSVTDRVVAAVDGQRALVFLGLGAADRLVTAFEAYQVLVPVDSYVVVEHTVVNGRPVASGFGPGPHEAVVTLLGRHHDFVPDVTYERYTITFDKGGFLRRMPAG